MLNFAIFVKYFSIDNSQPWLTDDLVNELHYRNYNITVFFFDVKGKCVKGVFDRSSNYKIYTYPLEKSLSKHLLIRKFILIKNYFGMYCYFIPKLVNLKVDRVISFSMFSIFFGFNRLIRLKNKSKIKSIAILWDFYPIHMIEINKIRKNLFAKLLYHAENYELKYFDDIFCMTDESIRFFNKYHPNLSHKPKKVIYLWRTITNNDFLQLNSKIMSFDSEKIYLTFGGQLSKGRGLDFLVDTAIEIKDSSPEVVFIVAGDGELMPSLLNKVKNNNLKNFLLLGNLVRENYLCILRKSHIGIVVTQSGVSIPSFPSKTIDYMQLKLPIIACVEESTDYGSIIKNEIGCGLVSTEGDRDSFIKNINELKCNSKLREKMGKNGYNFLKEKMSTSYVIDIIMNS